MSKKTILRIAEWIIILPLSYYSFQYAETETDKYIRDVVDVPQQPILHVDAKNSEGFQNGSFEYPFSTIEAALDYQHNNDAFNTILIGPGDYNETLEIADNLKLFGFNGTPNIKNSDPKKSKTVVAGDKTVIANLNVDGGKYGLYIPQDKTVTLFGVIISNATKWGIYNDKHSNVDSAKLSLINSQVERARRQGLYLQKGTFYMNRSNSTNNGEEGVDLHADMKTIIRNSIISSNGEGGLETELGNINLYIESSVFEKNGSSGINLQSFEDDSIVVLKNNIIKNNSDFGVRCALHSKIKSPYFSRMVKFEENNVFENNGKAKIDPNCSNR